MILNRQRRIVKQNYDMAVKSNLRFRILVIYRMLSWIVVQNLGFSLTQDGGFNRHAAVPDAPWVDTKNVCNDLHFIHSQAVLMAV